VGRLLCEACRKPQVNHEATWLARKKTV
jgi:hypothetical protein